MDKFRRTPLHWAARFNNPLIVDILCEVGVKSSLVDMELQTALSLAQHHNHTEVVLKLKKNET